MQYKVVCSTLSHVLKWPMAIALFHPTHGTKKERGMAVMGIPPVGLDSKKIIDKNKPPAMIEGLIE